MEEDAAAEDKTGCCLRNDLNACWQSERSKCTSTFADFKEGKVRPILDASYKLFQMLISKLISRRNSLNNVLPDIIRQSKEGVVKIRGPCQGPDSEAIQRQS